MGTESDVHDLFLILSGRRYTCAGSYGATDMRLCFQIEVEERAWRDGERCLCLRDGGEAVMPALTLFDAGRWSKKAAR